MSWQQEGKKMEREVKLDNIKLSECLCGRKIPTFKQTLLIIAKFLRNPDTPQKLIDQAINDLGKIGDYLDKQQKGKK